MYMLYIADVRWPGVVQGWCPVGAGGESSIKIRFRNHLKDKIQNNKAKHFSTKKHTASFSDTYSHGRRTSFSFNQMCDETDAFYAHGFYRQGPQVLSITIILATIQP